MKNLILTLMLGVFLASVTSAIFYPGGCYDVEFPNNESVIFEIISNETSMEGFNWNKTNEIITYCFSADFEPNKEVRVRWFNEGYEDIVEEVIVSSGSQGVSSGSRSSSGGSKSCSTQWNCSAWSICYDGIQTRICDYQKNLCPPQVSKPYEIQNCPIVLEEPKEMEEPENTTDVDLPKPKELAPTQTAVVILLIVALGVIIFLIHRETKIHRVEKEVKEK